MAALELGEFSILTLSYKTGIKRTTCYVIIEDLVRKGLIASFPRAKKTLYSATHPEVLAKNSERSYQLAKNIAPELQGIMKTVVEKPNVKVYIGRPGLQTIFDDFLINNKEKEIRYITSISEMVTAVGEEYLDLWVERRVNQGIKTISIRIKDKEMEKELYTETEQQLREIKYAPKDFYIPYSVHVYGKKIAFISTEKDLFGFIVESTDFNKTIRAFFDLLWITSEKKDDAN